MLAALLETNGLSVCPKGISHRVDEGLSFQFIPWERIKGFSADRKVNVISINLWQADGTTGLFQCFIQGNGALRPIHVYLVTSFLAQYANLQ